MIEPARRSGAERTTLANPAQAWLDRARGLDALAVRGVRLRTLDDLAALHGYVLEPAWRPASSCWSSARSGSRSSTRAYFVDPEFEYPYTLERALHAATQIWRGAPATRAEPPPAALDAEQLRAVATRDGTVQVIAPAGSGKTTVLIERVARAAAPRRRAPSGSSPRRSTAPRAIELAERLAAAGVRAVEARTFHSLGLRLLREEGLTRPGGVALSCR